MTSANTRVDYFYYVRSKALRPRRYTYVRDERTCELVVFMIGAVACVWLLGYWKFAHFNVISVAWTWRRPQYTICNARSTAQSPVTSVDRIEKFVLLDRSIPEYWEGSRSSEISVKETNFSSTRTDYYKPLWYLSVFPIKQHAYEH